MESKYEGRIRVHSLRSIHLTNLATAIETAVNRIDSDGGVVIDIKYSSAFECWDKRHANEYSALIIYKG